MTEGANQDKPAIRDLFRIMSTPEAQKAWKEIQRPSVIPDVTRLLAQLGPDPLASFNEPLTHRIAQFLAQSNVNLSSSVSTEYMSRLISQIGSQRSMSVIGVDGSVKDIPMPPLLTHSAMKRAFELISETYDGTWDMFRLSESIFSYHRYNRPIYVEDLLSLDPHLFEHLVAKVIERYGGLNVQTTSRSNDKGVDVIYDQVTSFNRSVTYVQVKRVTSVVGTPVINSLEGAIKASLVYTRRNARLATIVTTSRFSKDAIYLAMILDVKLVDGDRFIRNMWNVDIKTKSDLTSITSEISASDVPPSRSPTPILTARMLP